jgi:DNA-binding NarL/FixJ family response regulator
MRLILVGTSEGRARMRASLNGAIRVVAEFPSLEAAEAAGTEADGILLSPEIRLKPLPGVRAQASGIRAAGGDDEGAFQEPLTSREIEVLELLAEGLPNRTIAARLGISDQTVKFHVASISGKLGAANRTDAVRRGVRRGFITL